MAFKTMQQLVTATELAIYQSAGDAVQIYSQDILVQMLNDAFSHIFDLHWWPRFRARFTGTLDGTTGQLTTVPTLITDFKDIKYVFPDQYSIPLAHMPLGYNTQTITGGTPRFIEGTSDTKLFRVYPLESATDVLVVGRTRPDDFILTDTVPMDALLLRHFAAWSYFTDDASNPAAAQKHQGLFENRLKSIEDAEFNTPISLNTDQNYIPDRWSESRW